MCTFVYFLTSNNLEKSLENYIFAVLNECSIYRNNNIFTIMGRKLILMLLFITCSLHAMAQTDYYYDSYYGTKIPLILNENKVLVCIPDDCEKVCERILANIQPFYSVTEYLGFSYFFITRTDLERLTSLDFWEEDSKSVIITPCYYRDYDMEETYREVFLTPFLQVTLKKEEDIDLLTSYAEEYKLKIDGSNPYYPLVYSLHVTLESEKNALGCANEMHESGFFESSQPDFAIPVSGAYEPSDPKEDDPMESLYGEWRLVGWNDKGTWVEVDTNYVCKEHLSIEFQENGYVTAWSLVNEINVGKLILNGNEMLWDTTWRGMTYVACNIMENNFFEKHIYEIKYYQLEGKLLRLYYTDEDYFMFTKDFDDSKNLPYAWYNGFPETYIGKVKAKIDEEVEVEIVQFETYIGHYRRHRPPIGGDVCHLEASDLATLSFEVGDKIAFRIIQYRRMAVENKREYQLKVEYSEGSEYATDRRGTMHNDQRMGWIIIDNEVNERQGGIYYYPMKTLSEEYLTEGLSVAFSGELYPTWITPRDSKGPSECYYLSIGNKFETSVRSVESSQLSSGALYDLSGRRVQGTPQKGVYIQNGKVVVIK